MRWIWFMLIGLAIIVNGGGCDFCGFKKCTENDKKNLRVDCEGISDLQLTALQKAYNEQKSDYLECCLDDDFVFYFNPKDSSQVASAFPEYNMDRTREILISANMLKIAKSVHLELTGDGVFDYPRDPAGQMKRLPRNFNLTIVLPDSSGFEITGSGDFIVRPEGAEYKIVEWWDYSGASRRDIEHDRSWGYIKWFFR